MNAFVATPPANAPASPVADAVANDGWYPALSLATTRQVLALTTAVTDARLRDAIIGAKLSMARQLRAWRTVKAAGGAVDFAGAADDRLTAEELGELYQRGIRALVAAELSDFEGEVSATEAGRDRIETRKKTADDHRRLATYCVRDITGKRRTKVRLV